MPDKQQAMVFSASPASAAAVPASLSPSRRAWLRFKRNRLGYWSLLVFCALVLVSLCAELVSNDRPLIVRYEGQTYFPMLKDYPEKTFGGDFETPTDYLDPFIRERITTGSNWALYTLNPYGPNTLNYFAKAPNPSAPTRDNWLGTDDRGRDLLAQLIYGFRVSVLFALALTVTGVALGVLTGAIQGFFGGKTDLAFQRFIEIWGSMPELYLLIIFSAVFAPSISLLLILLSLFGWMGLSDYVRAEFLRNRQLDYVKAARALGVGNAQIIWRHILPNSLTPVVTFLPFRMSAAILALTSLDFLGLGVPPGTPSLGELLSQGKNSIDAWWISLSTFGVLVVTLLLLTFMGDALRDALDPERPTNDDPHARHWRVLAAPRGGSRRRRKRARRRLGRQHASAAGARPVGALRRQGGGARRGIRHRAG
jgi:microcin C transport system permease protein